jgi:hypothetical protein
MEPSKSSPKVIYSATLAEIRPHYEVRASVLQDQRHGDIYTSIKFFRDGVPTARGVSIKLGEEAEAVRRVLFEMECAVEKERAENL